MRFQKTHLLLAGIGVFAFSLQACKTKKIVAKPNPPVAVEKPVEKPVEKAPVEEKVETPAPEKPNFNFANVQFEFNSDVLKTASFQILDNAAKEMKKDPSPNLFLTGTSSAKVTPGHNMSYSFDRANSINSYLLNAGLSVSN